MDEKFPKRKSSAADSYECLINSYEYILEKEVIDGSSSNLPPGAIGPFRKKSNPLYIHDYDENETKSVEKPAKLVHGKCFILIIVLSFLISITSAALASYVWILKTKELQSSKADLSECQYKTSDGVRSSGEDFIASIPFHKLSAWIESRISTDVQCEAGEGMSATLTFDGNLYICNCTGESEVKSRICKIHYWLCPKT